MQTMPTILAADVRAEQLTVAASRAAVVREPPTVASQWYDPTMKTGFPTIVGWAKLRTNGHLYPTRGVIEQLEPQSTAASMEIEMLRVAVAVFKKYAHIYTVDRELYRGMVKRTADKDMGLNLGQLLNAAERQTQVAALSSVLNTLADGDVDPLVDKRDPEVYRKSVAVLDPVERELIATLQAWVEETFFTDVRRFVEYMTALSTPSVRVLPPKLSPYAMKLLFSPRPWNMHKYHEFIVANPSIWPEMARIMHARVAQQVPALHMGPNSLATLQATVSPSLTQVSSMDELFSSSSVSALTQSAAQSYWEGISAMCMCNYRSRLVFATTPHTPSMANIMSMLATFAFPTWWFDEETVNITRNMIVRMLVRLTTWNDSSARTGMVDYSTRNVNPKIPQALDQWLHQVQRPALLPMDATRAYYEGGAFNDVFIYPLGREIMAPDEDMSYQASLLDGIVQFLSNSRVDSPLETNQRRKLVAGIVALRDVLYRVPAILLAMQLRCVGAMKRAGCIIEQPGEYAYSGPDGHTASVAMPGALSLLFSEVAPVAPYDYDPTLANFVESQAIGSTMAAVADAHHLVHDTAAVAKWFTQDRVTAVTNLFRQFGPANWLSDVIINSMLQIPLKRQLVVPSERGPWYKIITWCRDMVAKYPSYFGYTTEFYVHKPTRRDMGGATNVSVLWAPADPPQDVITQHEVMNTLLYDPDQLRDRLYSSDGAVVKAVVKVRSEIFDRSGAPVPDQDIEDVVDVRVSELPVGAKRAITYYITTADDDTTRLDASGSQKRPPTVSVTDPGYLNPDGDMASYALSLITTMLTRRETMRLVDPKDFNFVVLRNT
jgi:hypothetical protein